MIFYKSFPASLQKQCKYLEVQYFLKPEVTSENEFKKMTSFFSKLVSTKTTFLKVKSTDINLDIFSGLSLFYLASDAVFLEVRVKVFHNVGVKEIFSIRFTLWQSLLPLLWCWTVLNQSSFTPTVSRNIFILSLPSIAFRFHLIKAGRLGKNGHRTMRFLWSGPFLHKRNPPIKEILLAGIHHLWC